MSVSECEIHTSVKTYTFWRNDKLISFLFADVLARPLQSTDAMPTKIQVLQFLSRIIEGERLGEVTINTLTMARHLRSFVNNMWCWTYFLENGTFRYSYLYF